MNENMMSDMVAVLHVLVYPGMALILSLGLTWVCVRVLPILGFIDKGGGRHIHKGASMCRAVSLSIRSVNLLSRHRHRACS